MYHTESSTQEDYNQAWANIPFTMEQRAADAMLNISLALLFGSGMPLVYLFAMLQVGVSFSICVPSSYSLALLGWLTEAQSCSERKFRSAYLPGSNCPHIAPEAAAAGFWTHSLLKLQTSVLACCSSSKQLWRDCYCEHMVFGNSNLHYQKTACKRVARM